MNSRDLSSIEIVNYFFIFCSSKLFIKDVIVHINIGLCTALQVNHATKKNIAEIKMIKS